ncbi:MAG: hypothetical protein LN566_05945 [Rickettsia endosymbiont of Stiretrus anchorago]|nr:hypothetical protein [Rickettsia endosymbiont of Stiretrus anchorago]
MFSNIDEKYLSHIPAVKALMAFGYKLLNQERLREERGNSHSILLEQVLIDKIKKLNSNKIDLDDKDNKDAKEAVRQLRDIKNFGLMKANEEVYDLLILGATIKSYNLKYIDWQEPENNTYHVAFEVPVKTKMNTENVCDIVLFVNGIPFVVIENKSPIESLEQAISQHLRNQGSDKIPQLFYYAQILIAVNKNEAKYATTGSSKKGIPN